MEKRTRILCFRILLFWLQFHKFLPSLPSCKLYRFISVFERGRSVFYSWGSIFISIHWKYFTLSGYCGSYTVKSPKQIEFEFYQCSCESSLLLLFYTQLIPSRDRHTPNMRCQPSQSLGVMKCTALQRTFVKQMAR